MRPPLTECMGRCRSTSIWLGKYGAVNWNEGLHSMLRGKLNRLVRRTKGYTKSVDMLVSLLALVFCAKLKLSAT